MKRKWWVISMLCVVLALVYVFVNRSGRLLWVADGGRQMGGLILSPRGEVVSPRGSSIDLLDANGKSRPLISNSANLVPLASAGERGFVAVRHAPGASETILIDWEGRQQWTFPVASFQLKVSPGGLIYFFGADTNFYALRPDGSLLWKRQLWDRKHNWSAMAVGYDDSVAFRYGFASPVMLLEQDGTVRWTSIDIGTEYAGEFVRDSEGGVIQAGLSGLKSVSPQGRVRWTIPFPPVIPAADASKRAQPVVRDIYSLAVDRRGYVYCHAADGLVYVLDKHGIYRWSHPRGQVGFGPDWIAFTELGDAIFGAGEYRAIGGAAFPSVVGGRILNSFAEFRRRLVCLSPEGELRWELPIGGEFNGFRPKSKIELEYLWKTRFGFAELNPVRSPVIGPNGVIYFTRYPFSTGTSKSYAVRSDAPKK